MVGFFYLALMVAFLSSGTDGSLFVHLAMKVTVLSSGTYGSLSPWTDVSLFHLALIGTFLSSDTHDSLMVAFLSYCIDDSLSFIWH